MEGIILASVRIVSRRFLLAQGPLLLLDGSDRLVYNMLIKGADTIVYAYPFPAKSIDSYI